MHEEKELALSKEKIEYQGVRLRDDIAPEKSGKIYLSWHAADFFSSTKSQRWI